MRKFDAEPNLSDDDLHYEIRGQVFTRRRRVMPEAMGWIEDAYLAATSIGVIEMKDRGILAFLILEDAERWRALREDPDEPLTIREITEVGNWLVEVEARFPTPQPSPSTNGPDGTAPSSTAPSSSPEAIPTG